MRHLIIDLETAPLPNVTDYLDPVEAARNLKDPEKIKADIEKRQADQLADCGLDWNLNRIVCAGIWDSAFVTGREEPTTLVAVTESDERALLADLASIMMPNVSGASRPLLVGFCIRKFDVPVILQRARYLGVKMPRISLKRYDNPHITDLYDLLTFDEQPCTSVMRRSLSSFCRRFGIDVEDSIAGMDVPTLIADGDWPSVEAHCLADVKKTLKLAQLLGVVEPVAVSA